MSAALSENYPYPEGTQSGFFFVPRTPDTAAKADAGKYDPHPTRYDLPVVGNGLLAGRIGAEVLQALDRTVPLDNVRQEPPAIFDELAPPELTARLPEDLIDDQPAQARPTTTTMTPAGTVFTWFGPTQLGGDPEPPGYGTL